jgi:imidazolonepropionase-like amidohydrolase
MPAVVIKASGLFDGTGHTVANPVVVVEGRRIAQVGTNQEKTSIPEGARVLDLSGCWLLPGLIDTHSHVSMRGQLKNYRQHMSDDIATRVIRATVNMKDDLKGGVTTIRNMGDKDFVDIAINKAIEAGDIPGPRIVTSGLGIRTSSGHGFVATVFDGEDEIRRAVRKNIYAGADVIKIFTTGDSSRSSKSFLAPSCMTLDEIKAVVEEAHSFGKPVAAHCTGEKAFSYCLDAGVDTIEHGFYVTDEDIKRAADENATIGFTINTVFNDRRVANRFDGPIPEDERQKQRVIKESLSKYMEAGVNFVVGTDAQHGELGSFDLIFLVQELGLSEADALRIATQKAAQVLQIDENVGTIEEGKLADMIAVKGNVLNDITALRLIKMVMKNGVLEKYI